MLLVSPLAHAEPATVQQAVQAYAAGQPDRARGIFATLAEETPHADLYFNLGQIAQGQNDLPWARYYYDQALVLNPRDMDARASRQLILDNLDGANEAQSSLDLWLARGFFLAEYLTTSEILSGLTFCWLALWLSLSLQIFRRTTVLRRITWTCLILFVVTALLTMQRQRMHEPSGWAISKHDHVAVKETFINSANELAQLSNAAKVRVISRQYFTDQPSWVQIQLPDGRTGWVLEVEVIL